MNKNVLVVLFGYILSLNISNCNAMENEDENFLNGASIDIIQDSVIQEDAGQYLQNGQDLIQQFENSAKSLREYIIKELWDQDIYERQQISAQLKALIDNWPSISQYLLSWPDPVIYNNIIPVLQRSLNCLCKSKYISSQHFIEITKQISNLQTIAADISDNVSKYKHPILREK